MVDEAIDIEILLSLIVLSFAKVIPVSFSELVKWKVKLFFAFPRLGVVGCVCHNSVG